MRQWGRVLTIGAFALGLFACAPVDDTTGSRLAQPPAGTPPRKPDDAGDIAIVGQNVAQSIMNLPVVANATVPPLVQFNGVTSIIEPPIDTDPYTQLLRDRLLLLTREKLRFVEHTLPPLVTSSGKKSRKKAAASTAESSTEPDYEILAELRGHANDDLYRIQVQFVDLQTSEVLFDGLYRIRKEAAEQPSDAQPDYNQPPPAQDTTAPPAPAPAGSL